MVRPVAVKDPVGASAGRPVGAQTKIGVEEEFHLVDLEDRRLVGRAAEVLAVLPDDGRFKPELLDSTVEINSAVCRSLAELRADLLTARCRLAGAARSLGLGVVAAGTVPIADPRDVAVAADERMAQMREVYQLVADEQMICGAQFQVDCPDRDLAAAVLPRLAPWLPVLLALSTSSPFWRSRDSGFASFRSQLWERWPTAGLPPDVRTAAEYHRVIEDLLATGTIIDSGMIYFDARASARYPTIEVRICDAVPLVDDVVMLAGLSRALVGRCAQDVLDGAPRTGPSRTVVRAARWRASRTGLAGDLLHPVTGLPVPARDAVQELLSFAGACLDESGDRAEVTRLVDDVLRRGSSAQQQRATLARRQRLHDVVDQLVAQTAGQGWPPPSARPDVPT